MSKPTENSTARRFICAILGHQPVEGLKGVEHHGTPHPKCWRCGRWLT